MEPIGDILTGNRLRLAEFQDYVLEIIYNRIEPAALLYGGTAVWRCYGGQRFSEGIDIHLRNESLEKLIASLPKYGVRLLWRDVDYPSRIRIGNNETSLLLESKEGYAESVVRQYFRVDGSPMTVSVLSPTELLIKKIEAYNGRRFIRDIYDMFILTRYLDPSDYTVISRLSTFLKSVAKPDDEAILSSLIYSGNNNLTFTNMLEYISGWLNEV